MDDHFLMGSIIGITQTIVGHPLDTLKIRSQNNISRHLFKNLYNGVSYPLMVSLYSNSYYLEYLITQKNKPIIFFYRGFCLVDACHLLLIH